MADQNQTTVPNTPTTLRQPWSRAAMLEDALRQMVYEATSLSSEEGDGSHWCRITGDTLRKAREAINDVR